MLSQPLPSCRVIFGNGAHPASRFCVLSLRHHIRIGGTVLVESLFSACSRKAKLSHFLPSVRQSVVVSVRQAIPLASWAVISSFLSERHPEWCRWSRLFSRPATGAASEFSGWCSARVRASPAFDPFSRVQIAIGLGGTDLILLYSGYYPTHRTVVLVGANGLLCSAAFAVRVYTRLQNVQHLRAKQ